VTKFGVIDVQGDEVEILVLTPAELDARQKEIVAEIQSNELELSNYASVFPLPEKSDRFLRRARQYEPDFEIPEDATLMAVA